MVQVQVMDFINRFLPQVETEIHPEGFMIRFTPHSLLFDFMGKYPHRFSTKEMQACLAGYLALSDPVIQEITNLKESTLDGIKAQHLYRLNHHDASELVLAYLGRTRQDEDFPTLVDYIRKTDAVAQLDHLLAVVDPQEQARSMDCCKRILSIRNILNYLLGNDPEDEG